MTQTIRQSGNVESVLNALRLHWSEEAPRDMRKAFEADPQRFAQLSAQLDGFLLDWSKCNVSKRTMQLLQLLAKAADIAGKRNAMFTGAAITFPLIAAVPTRRASQTRGFSVLSFIFDCGWVNCRPKRTCNRFTSDCIWFSRLACS